MSKNLPEVSLEKIISSKNTLHQAVQLIALVARGIKPAVEDDHFANLNWNVDLASMLGNELELDGSEFQAGLNLETLKVFILKNGAETDGFKLEGKTFEEAFQLIKKQWSELGFNTERFSTEMPYDIPEYPEANGAVFQIKDKAATQVIVSGFNMTQALLEDFREKNKNVDQIKCWPHHFDLATLKTFPDKHEDASVGLGFSPGDEEITEPYFYVNCWPYPEIDRIKVDDISSGSWNLEDWVGTTLTYSELVTTKDQYETVKMYLKESFEHLSLFALEAAKSE